MANAFLMMISFDEGPTLITVQVPPNFSVSSTASQAHTTRHMDSL